MERTIMMNTSTLTTDENADVGGTGGMFGNYERFLVHLFRGVVSSHDR